MGVGSQAHMRARTHTHIHLQAIDQPKRTHRVTVERTDGVGDDGRSAVAAYPPPSLAKPGPPVEPGRCALAAGRAAAGVALAAAAAVVG